ncbi:MAG: LPXTG cell wall anchor domain-containing protein [Eggerthellaceae bacterium]|nr:LPXTG cell wall anchor domain-containing protein [Eggerthellaceae bacterium]
MNTINNRGAARPRNLRAKAAAFALSLVLGSALVLAPSSAWASGDSAPTEAVPAPVDAVVAPAEAAPAPADDSAPEAAPTGDRTMTFYYYEPLSYEDPDYSHPSGLRLLKTKVVGGLSVGDVLDTWDYVDDIEGHFFFDAYPAKPVVSEDDSKNFVELMYFKRCDNPLTINYYELSSKDGWDIDLSDPSNLDVTKMGSFTKENLRYDLKVHADEVVVPVSGMDCVGSYPEQLRLTTDRDRNVISVFYADEAPQHDPTPLPDDVLVEDDVTTLPDDKPIEGDDSSEDNDSSEGDDSAADDGSDAGDGDGSATAPGGSESGDDASSDAGTVPGGTDSVAEDADATSADDESSSGKDAQQADELPQTGDASLALMPLALTSVIASLTLMIAARRQAKSNR